MKLSSAIVQDKSDHLSQFCLLAPFFLVVYWPPVHEDEREKQQQKAS